QCQKLVVGKNGHLIEWKKSLKNEKLKNPIPQLRSIQILANLRQFQLFKDKTNIISDNKLSEWALKDNEKIHECDLVKRMTEQLMIHVQNSELEQVDVPKITRFSRRWKEAIALRSLEEKDT
ncbi:7143_t:CDS:2, partial [Scutellospora calospora]